MTIKSDIESLTTSIPDANEKHYLASTLSSALEALEHAPAEIIKALDDFFTHRTLQ